MTLAELDFSFNCLWIQTIIKSLYEIVYGHNHINPIDLISQVTSDAYSVDDKQCSAKIQQLHRQVMEMISKQNDKYQTKANKNRRVIRFKKEI